MISPLPRASKLPCPHCGAPVARGALFCPGCGSDARTGWSAGACDRDAGIPDEFSDADYEDLLAREGLGGRRRPVGPMPRLFIKVVAALLILAFLLLILTR